jgi:hypothetical protein
VLFVCSQKHMDMHLAPFARARAAQEEKQREETRAEEEARAARLREKQAAAREQLQQNQAYTRSWNSGGMQEWRSNMERIEATKTARKTWNSKVAQQEAAKTSLGQRERRHEVASGIDEFERNLERIGAGANNNNSSAAAASGSSDDAAAYQQAAGQEISAVQQMSVKLAASLGSPAQLAKQVRFTILRRLWQRMLVLLAHLCFVVRLSLSRVCSAPLLRFMFFPLCTERGAHGSHPRACVERRLGSQGARPPSS